MNPTEETQNTGSAERPEDKQESRGQYPPRPRKRTYRPMGRMGPPDEYMYRHPQMDSRGYGRMQYRDGRDRGYGPAPYDAPHMYHPYRMDPRGPYPNEPMYHRRYMNRQWPPYYDEQRMMRPSPYRRRKILPVEQVPVNVLGIFGLDIRLKEEELTEWIKEIIPEIEISKIELIPDKHSEYSRGFAFIYFNTIEDATAAKEKLTGQICHGHPIRVEYSITASGHKKEEQQQQPEPSEDPAEIQPQK
ncbi:transformer-2 protein [Nematocida sp. AWRm80]|nr:transformer-2 protein [Nematocida sp. AWRm80]